MKLKNNLEINQSQKLSINLQMQESLEILQLSIPEIIKKVNKELEKNPLLELDIAKEKINLYKSNIIQNNTSDSTSEIVEKTLKKKKSLREHISEQINIDITNSEEKLIAQKLLEYVDNNGYIKKDDINKIYQDLNKQNYTITIALIEKVLRKVQEFDPPGIFARDLSECIEIQLRQKKIFNSKYHFLIKNLELIAKKDMNILLKKTRLKKNEIVKMIDNIKILNPKPANVFDFQPNVSIVPDIILSQNKGSFKLEVNKSQIPKFKFNKELYSLIKKKKLLNREKENLIKWVKSGKLLLSSIKNRGITLEKVTNEIVKFQQDFFKKGINYFYPLTQKDIAKKTGFHESTISRCTNNKYIETPNGVYELKYFFSRGIDVKDKAKLLSNKIIKNKILNIIKKENNNIMSDRHIVFKLKKKGINIARRTVSKYRKLMSIPSSHKRKKQF
tara:strand:- start:525 stop:1862 length:1338 start_codon:yes stop_codon:yes gene_type:complete